MLTLAEEAEIAGLAAKFGAPLRWQRRYRAETERNRTWLKRILKRRGEAILVVPRPGDQVLLHTKDTYPDGVYRLPGGGIDPGEEIELAARRETREEMGFDVPLARFLGVVENVFLSDGERLYYPSYIFASEPTTEPPQVMDPDERITGFRQASIDELGQVAAQLDGLPDDWQPWGKFRAARTP